MAKSIRTLKKTIANVRKAFDFIIQKAHAALFLSMHLAVSLNSFEQYPIASNKFLGDKITHLQLSFQM